MFFEANTASLPHVAGHWRNLWANRRIWDSNQQAVIAAHRAAMAIDPELLAANSFGEYGTQFWKAIDNQVVMLRNQTVGMELVDDLMRVQKVLPIGKTANLYNISGDIADDVKITMDGQAPYSFDHTDYTTDGDPIPVFTAGYGVNWRLAAGLNTVGVDLVLDSQEAKLRKYNERLVKYMLDGSTAINVDGKAGQGLRNHRNTVKVNLGSGLGGASIDLTTASQDQIIKFFTTGAFGQTARANFVDVYDVLWVSPEIWANMDNDYVNGGVINGTIRERVIARSRVREIRETYALSGNEYIAYQRRTDVLQPLVGMTTGVVPLPRRLPQDNYNFQIMGAAGLQIKRDGMGRSGVQYGKNIA